MTTMVETMEEGSAAVERFVSDERGFNSDTEDKVVSRMRSPTDALMQLRREGTGRFDLAVDDANLLNLEASDDGTITMAPTMRLADTSASGASLAADLDKRGFIPVDPSAVNQLCSLMGIAGGWKTYQKRSRPAQSFMRDVRDTFGGKSGATKFVVRTTGDGFGNHRVEAFFDANAERPDSGRVVGGIFRAILEKYGDVIRGVEMIRQVNTGVGSMRILFGDPVLRERTSDPMKRIYPMMDLFMSDRGNVTPEASLGLWRLWCLNGCTSKDFALARLRMDSEGGMDAFIEGAGKLVNAAIPFAHAIATRLDGLQDRPLAKSAKDTIDLIEARGHISKGFAEDLDRYRTMGREGEVETEWGMFNLFTDAARMRGSVASRRGVENKGLQFALADGGFSGVADSGFNRSQFARQMKGIWEDAGLEIPTKAQARLN
tara:strand:- start:35809 stop:37104 length:1296 start_codon:yes stop_codon:yes gene_type:complete